MGRERKFPVPPHWKVWLQGHLFCPMISTDFPARIVLQLRGANTCALGAAFGQQIRVVPISSSRDVSDPRTDPGVRVRGPEVGSLTSRLLSCAGHPRGKTRRANASRY